MTNICSKQSEQKETKSAAAAQISIFYLLKHQARSTDIVSTSWQSKEQQKKELEQQSFSFSTSWYSVQLHPLSPKGRPSLSLSLQSQIIQRKGKWKELNNLFSFEKGHPLNFRTLVLNTGLTTKTWTKGEGRKKYIGPQQKYKMFFV